MRVDATSYDDVSQRVVGWAQEGKSSYVCVANVHMTMETFDSAAFRCVVNEADLVTPDGRPLVWALKALGLRGASQVRGADLFFARGRAGGTRGRANRAVRGHARIACRPRPLPALAFSGYRSSVQHRSAFSPFDGRGRRGGEARDKGFRGTHLVRGDWLSQTGEVDGDAQGSRAGGYAGCGGGLRFPYRSEAPGSPLDAGGGSGMGFPVRDGSAAAVETLC